MRPRLLLLFFFLMLLGLFVPGWAQQKSAPSLTRTSWEKVTRGVDYSENIKLPENKPSTRKPHMETPSIKWNFGFLKYVLYGMVIVLLLILLFRVLVNLNNNPVLKKQDLSIDTILEAEANLPDVDLNTLLQQALNEQNFPFALRIHFLMVIQHLANRELISWKQDKTNWEYHSELRSGQLKERFREIILSYERIWYGEHPLTQEGYEALSLLYNAFIQPQTGHEEK
ncbi:MAG: DUF4129 domain-containing protein [Flavobacteriales bacterium]|nr:DUF4129 domain-containing protein [Flavobacteriales bacterium]MCB9448998.1 DUF4129 domain-containing protein [Flavobacteriales bacterium]